MSVSVSVRVSGEKVILDDFEDAAERFEKPVRPLLQEIGDLLVKSIRERFDRKEDPKGNKWQPQSPVTQKINPAGSLLVETGRMRDSIGIKSIGNTSVKVGTVGDPKRSYWMYYGVRELSTRSAVPGATVPGRWWLGGISRRTFGQTLEKIEAYFLGDDRERDR